MILTIPKRTIAVLPLEELVTGMESLYPSATVPLHVFYDFGKGDGVRQQQQDVNMVADTTNHNDLASRDVDHASDVTMHTLHILFANRWTRGFDMKYQVYIYFV